MATTFEVYQMFDGTWGFVQLENGVPVITGGSAKTKAAILSIVRAIQRNQLKGV
jgi:hypothetical protein